MAGDNLQHDSRKIRLWCGDADSHNDFYCAEAASWPNRSRSRGELGQQIQFSRGVQPVNGWPVCRQEFFIRTLGSMYAVCIGFRFKENRKRKQKAINNQHPRSSFSTPFGSWPISNPSISSPLGTTPSRMASSSVKVP